MDESRLIDHKCGSEDLRCLVETSEFMFFQCKHCFSHRVVVKNGVKEGARREAFRNRVAQITELLRQHDSRRRYF